jgi:hypothetical protein
MLGTNVSVPLLTAVGGALFATMISGQDAWKLGAAIGFGAGCAIIGLIWLLFAVLGRMAE